MRNRLEWTLLVAMALLVFGALLFSPELPKLETEAIIPGFEATAEIEQAETQRRNGVEQERKDFFDMFGVWPEATEAEKIVLVQLRELGARMDEVRKAHIVYKDGRYHPDVTKFAHARALAYRFRFDPDKANKQP